MVTICTTSLTFNNSTFCPHTVFMCFVWISEQTAIISLYNINWLVFITQTRCVYCAVRTGCLNGPAVNLILVTSNTLTVPPYRSCRPYTKSAAQNGLPFLFVYLKTELLARSQWAAWRSWHRPTRSRFPVVFLGPAKNAQSVPTFHVTAPLPQPPQCRPPNPKLSPVAHMPPPTADSQ